MMIENVRFHKAETKNDPEFSKSLAALAEVYVNDAFGTAHRAQCSTEGVAHFLSPAVIRLPDRQRARYYGQSAGKSRSGRLWRCWAARRCPTRST